MKKFMKIKRSEKGFTLLEIIITIVVAAVLASFLITFMGTAITKSQDPVKQTRHLGTTIGGVETLTAKYVSYLKSEATWAAIGVLCVSLSCEYDQTIDTATVIYAAGKPADTVNAFKFKVTTGDQNIVTYFMQ
jgi:prepilin-type N-terminal cleavage/methylation domain-containing protein